MIFIFVFICLSFSFSFFQQYQEKWFLFVDLENLDFLSQLIVIIHE